MEFYLVSGDGDDLPDEPLLASSVAEAADLYVQAVLAGRAAIGISDLRRGLCINISGFEAPAEGAGLMRDTVATSVPMSHIPSWRAHLEARSAGLSEGPG
jgi:hypothetical protein